MLKKLFVLGSGTGGWLSLERCGNCRSWDYVQYQLFLLSTSCV